MMAAFGCCSPGNPKALRRTGTTGDKRRTMSRSRSGPSLFPDLPPIPDLALESALLRDGLGPICGVDEAGRGPLAGPVVAAAVILDPERLPDGIDDSKRMDAPRRDAAFLSILGVAHAVAFASVAAEAIDASDIRKASLEAMRRAVMALALVPGFVLCDGRDTPGALPCPARAVIKGDQRSMSVAAASIVAKVMRDRMMDGASLRHPTYGFAAHKGYGTAMHLAALAANGPAGRLHRMSFRPLRAN